MKSCCSTSICWTATCYGTRAPVLQTKPIGSWCSRRCFCALSHTHTGTLPYLVPSWPSAAPSSHHQRKPSSTLLAACARYVLTQRTPGRLPSSYANRDTWLCWKPWQVVAYTHYMPNSWRGRTNTYDVRDEFLSLYQFKVVLFLQEIVGAVTTPFLLLFSLPRVRNQPSGWW